MYDRSFQPDARRTPEHTAEIAARRSCAETMLSFLAIRMPRWSEPLRQGPKEHRM